MSKSIKITIVMDDEKLNNKVDDSRAESLIVTQDSSMTIMSTLLKNDLISGSFCGGRGDCGRCRIRFLKGVTAPTALERSVMEPEELRQNYRLACFAKPKDDCVIKLALSDAAQINIVTDVIDVTERNDCLSQYNLLTENHTLDVTESANKIVTVNTYELPVILKQPDIPNRGDDKDQDTLIAVDLGTTTIAMQLMSMDTGRVIDTYCELNPQRRYGSDVLSRIQSSCEGNREVLQALVIEVLERGVDRFRNQDVNIKCMCIAGNTTMEHLLMGYDVSSLGSSPFTPVEIGLQEYRHPVWDFTVWLVPGISAFVGGDIVAGLYTCGMLTRRIREKPANQFMIQRTQDNQMWGTNSYIDSDSLKSTILIDLGTNGEMAITDGTRMIVTATAAGPAFEGGAVVDIVGSDMIACIAELLRQGIVDETGLLAEPFFAEGVSLQSANIAEYGRNDIQSNKYEDMKNYVFTPGRSGHSLYLTQDDIRSLQMAKAAVRTGIEILLNKMNEQQDKPQLRECQVERVYLAGGFGYYLNVESAFRIGLLPEHMRGLVQAVGNTSLMGAYRIGRDLWQNRISKQILEQSLSSIESINLAKQEEFEKLYIQNMNFISSWTM